MLANSIKESLVFAEIFPGEKFPHFIVDIVHALSY